MTLSASISSKPAVLSLEFSCEEVEMVVYFKIYFMIHFPRKTPGGVFDRCFCVPSWGAFLRERQTCRATNTCVCRYICRHLHKPRDQWAKKQTDRRSHQYCSTYLGTVGNSAAPPPFGLLTVSRCDDIFFFSLLKVGSNARGNEFVMQVEHTQGDQGRRGRTSAIFFSYRVRV